MAVKMSFLIIQTGGTIDKDYPKNVGGYAFEISDAAANRVFDRVRPAFDVEYTTVCQKDSQDITDNDREKLYETCQNTSHKKILITHGTDTMIETASYLAKKPLPKTIVLTGAIKPETFKNSDSDFNLGVAIGAMQFKTENGVYIAMNGGVHAWDKVVREPDSGVFKAKI